MENYFQLMRKKSYGGKRSVWGIRCGLLGRIKTGEVIFFTSLTVLCKILKWTNRSWFCPKYLSFSVVKEKKYVKDVRQDVTIWIRISFVAVVGEQNISTEIVVLVFLGKYQLTFVKLHVKVINSNSKTATNNLYLDEGHSVFVKMFSSTCLFHCFQWAFAVAIEIKWVIVHLYCDYILKIMLFLCAEIFSLLLQGPSSSVNLIMNRWNCLEICCTFLRPHLDPCLHPIWRLVLGTARPTVNFNGPRMYFVHFVEESNCVCVWSYQNSNLQLVS